jgi:type IV pilus assembly protein PilW
MTYPNKSFVHRFSNPPRRMSGLSLIELMVAIALGLIILAGLITVFVNSSAARNEVERTGRQIENGRYAVDILTDDLRLAGFFGEMNPITANETFSIPVPSAMPDPCSTTPADWGPALYVHLQGYNASNGSLSCMPASYKAGTDVLVVRRVRACAAGVGGCEAVDADKPYLQVSLCSTESPVTPYVLDLGSVSPTLKLKDCSTLAGQRQYLVNIYFISTDNGTGAGPCPGNPECVPTLKRLEFAADGTFAETTLVEGIEQINIEYGIDTNDDGVPDAYTTDPTNYPTGCSPCASVTNWRNVMTARFFVLARNIDVSPGYTDNKTYTLGSTVVGPFNDGYRRHIYASLVRITNPAGRRDTP